MARSKKTATSPPVLSSVDPNEVLNRMNFESLEEKIRGEQILVEAETRSAREAADVKKKLDESELDRRMEELRRKLGHKKS